MATRCFTIPKCEPCVWWRMSWWVLIGVHRSVWTLLKDWILPCLWNSWHFEGFWKLLRTWYWSIFKMPWRKQRAVESPVRGESLVRGITEGKKWKAYFSNVYDLLIYFLRIFHKKWNPVLLKYFGISFLVAICLKVFHYADQTLGKWRTSSFLFLFWNKKYPL